MIDKTFFALLQEQVDIVVFQTPNLPREEREWDFSAIFFELNMKMIYFITYHEYLEYDSVSSTDWWEIYIVLIPCMNQVKHFFSSTPAHSL